MNSEIKILVCDDEPHIVHVVSSKLRNAGFDIVTAADGEEAWQLAQEHRPNLVVTDYQMPFLSGLELCTKLRADESLGQVPVIMLTARGFCLSDSETASTNIKKVLPKPFSPREILRNVEELLQAGSAS